MLKYSIKYYHLSLSSWSHGQHSIGTYFIDCFFWHKRKSVMSLTQLIIEGMICTVHAISFLGGLLCLCDSKYFYSSVEQDQTMYVLFTRQFLIFFPRREKKSYIHIVCWVISMVLFFGLLYNYYSSFTPPTLLCICD